VGLFPKCNQRRIVQPYFILSERIGFREWTLDDFSLAMQLWGDPLVTQFITASGQLTEEEVRQRLAKEMATREAHGIQYWPIFALEGNEFLGCCGLRPFGTDDRVRELGFHLCAARWGKGYATEAAHAVIGYAFSWLGLDALFAGHNPNNTASRYVLTKLGFRYTHDEFYEPTGLQHPSYWLTRENWFAREE
jgi:RimJ/RimL family protein N-acetyltransferase